MWKWYIQFFLHNPIVPMYQFKFAVYIQEQISSNTNEGVFYFASTVHIWTIPSLQLSLDEAKLITRI